MLSFFKKFKDGFSKTVSEIAAKTRGLFGGRKIDAASLEELEEALYTADFGVETTGEILAEIEKAYREDKDIEGRKAAEIGAAVLQRVLAGSEGKLPEGPRAPGAVKPEHPTVIAMIGVNGSGKTTTIAKLARLFLEQDYGVMLAAGDTFRAAAIEQLRIWADRIGVPIMAGPEGGDAAGIVWDAVKQATATGIDVLIVDTAGRLQNKRELMDELAKIRRVLGRLNPEAPHDVVLVLDATTGQNALSQIEVFKEVAGVTGLVMTKLDGTARGGVLVAAAEKFGMPIHAIGVGEGMDDLRPFDAREVARMIAGIES